MVASNLYRSLFFLDHSEGSRPALEASAVGSRHLQHLLPAATAATTTAAKFQKDKDKLHKVGLFP